MNTGIWDRNKVEIQEGDFVSLDGNITADDSLGFLPNGWVFGEDDVYEVIWDERCKAWGLKLGVEPDSPINIKYINHCYSLLNSGEITKVK